MVDLGATSSQELLDGSSPIFQRLVELCKGLANFAFIWWVLKGRWHGKQRKIPKIAVFTEKIFFVALPFLKRLEYRNGNWQLRSTLNMTASCANMVMIGGVTPEKRLLIFVLLRKKITNTRNAWQSLAYSPLGAIVSPPSEYLWKTLTYWSPECLTAPFHSEHRK